MSRQNSSPLTLWSVLQPWDSVQLPLLQAIGRFVEPEQDQDVIWVGCAYPGALFWWTDHYGGTLVGVDPREEVVEACEDLSSETGSTLGVSFQVARITDLPHEERVFDLTIFDALHVPYDVAAQAVAEAGRVARPMSGVVGVVPTWLSTPTEADSEELASEGVKPQMLVEWKNNFREAGFVELQVDDLSSGLSWVSMNPLGSVFHGWNTAGWAGVKVVFSPFSRTIRRLAARRVLGLSLIKGSRWPHS